MKWAAFVVACVVSGSACYSTPSRRLCLEPGFSAEEREEISKRTERWRDFTVGREDATVSCEFQQPNVHRVTSREPLVVLTDAAIGGPALGITVRGQIYFVVDRIYDGGFSFGAIAQHEIGHFIGLRWPNCDEDKQDCVHISNAGGAKAIMTKQISGVDDFTEADRSFCIVSGVCPSNPSNK